VNVSKVLGVALLIGCVVQTREQILGFIAVVALSVAFFGIKGGFFTLMTGGPSGCGAAGERDRRQQRTCRGADRHDPAAVLPDPAGRGTGQAAFPEPLNPKDQAGPDVSIGLCAASVLGSHSRGALLAMSSMAIVLWWRSKSKLTIGIVLLILAPALIMFMPAEWGERMGTIKTYDADASAMGRINAWTMAINIANSRILGAGFATDSALVYRMYAPNPNEVLVAHSIYFQVLGQHGYIGLALFLTFWILTYRTAGRLMKLARAP
jgi:hypothetical protein